MLDSSRPLCSVIIPVFNVRKWLPESMDSLVPQACGDLEVILVDDGSADGSEKLCNEYGEKLPLCRVIHQRNQGVAAARNTGLRAATGEYILWLDPDDRLEKDWFSAIREKLTECRPDLLLFDYRMLYGNKTSDRIYGRPEGEVEPAQFMTDLIINIRQTGSLWNKATRRDLLKDITFDETMNCMEDMNLLFRIAPHARKIFYTPRILYTYRIRDEGLVRRPDLKTAYRCYEEALMYKAYAESRGYGSFIQGVLPHAKGFCCKYYSLGCPPEFKKEYETCRDFLIRNRKAIRHLPELKRTEKWKYLLIPYRPVGRIYAKKQ